MVEGKRNSILFSIIIPTYNRAKTIRKTIESVLNQTFQSFEIIVVDDGSIDDTRSIVLSIKSEKIFYIYQTNQGAQAARNSGLKNANGKYLAFLDSDDELTPRYIEKMVKKHESCTTGMCIYGFVAIEDESENLSLLHTPKLRGYIYNEVLQIGFLKGPICISAPREFFLDVGGWDEKFKSCQDDDMCFRLSQKYRFDFIPEILVIAHINYDGGNRRISASMNRVANGWLQLWEKYENDVLEYCGKKTMGKHYLSCSKLFLQAGDRCMGDKILSKSLNFYDFQVECDNFFKDIFTKKIYCYGAGEYAVNIGKYLILHHYKIEGFLVTDGKSKKDFILDIPVFYASRLMNEKNSAVLLTVSEKYHESIKAILLKYNIDEIYSVPDEYYNWIWVYNN